MGDAAEVTRLARGQAQKADRVVTEATERLRTQIIRADQILTGTLEVIEEAGQHFPPKDLGAGESGIGGDQGHQSRTGIPAPSPRRRQGAATPPRKTKNSSSKRSGSGKRAQLLSPN